MGRQQSFAQIMWHLPKSLFFSALQIGQKNLSAILGWKPIFVPKSWCSLKKKSSPKFGNYFLLLIIVATLKFLILPKFFISLSEKFWFSPNIFLSLPPFALRQVRLWIYIYILHKYYIWIYIHNKLIVIN